MKVENIVEHEDGTATLSVTDISVNDQRLLMQEGLRSILTEYANRLVVDDAGAIKELPTMYILRAGEKGYVKSINENGEWSFCFVETNAMLFDEETALRFLKLIEQCGGELKIIPIPNA